MLPEARQKHPPARRVCETPYLLAISVKLKTESVRSMPFKAPSACSLNGMASSDERSASRLGDLATILLIPSYFN